MRSTLLLFAALAFLGGCTSTHPSRFFEMRPETVCSDGSVSRYCSAITRVKR